MQNADASGALASLGLASGETNRLNAGMTLESLASRFASDLQFDEKGNISFTINSQTFTFSKSTTLSKMMSTINSDKTANVTMSYDEITDRFVLTSKQSGAGDNLVFGSEQGDINFINSFGFNVTEEDKDGYYEEGKDASAMIDGVLVTRSTNTFSINNVKYTLNKAHTDPANESETVTLTFDTDAVYDNIKAFVDDYNKLIESINSIISEKYDRNYQPLTDEQKEQMSEDEIKKWESKAKTGLLHNDSMLQDMLYKMRIALSDSVSGISDNLSSIGITTGNYSEKGKLIINETELKKALEEDPDSVSELFTKKAEISYAECKTSAQRSERYSTEGLGYRISDILEDYIKTTNGKGMLLQKAGMEGDATQYDNMLYDEIDDYEDDIKELLKKLADKENQYYSKFTTLETYINQMNSQSAYITSLFSSGS
jgi:flagellar hook-associated protein 2